MRFGGLRLRVAFFLLFLAVWGGMPQAAELRVTEEALKSAFVYHLFNFATWPETAVNADQERRICVWPGYTGRKEIEALAGEKVGGHTISVSTCDHETCVRSCHVLLLPEQRSDELSGLMSILRGEPVLTLTDASSELAGDTLIQFFHDQRQLRMAIDIENTRQSGIEISSRLLRLMRIVEEGEVVR